MIETLILSMFEKAAERTGRKGVKRPLAKDICDWMFDNLRDKNDQRISISVRTIERLYEKFVDKKEVHELSSDPKGEKLDYFARYIGYSSYEVFIQKMSSETEENSDKTKDDIPKTTVNAVITDKVDSRKIYADKYVETDNSTTINNPVNWITRKRGRLLLFLSLFTAIVVTIILLSLNKDEELCLVWKKNHYESVACQDVSNEDISIAVDQKDWESDYKKFKRIYINENTALINGDGQALVWYYKAGNTYEFYNAKGTHPINGEQLRPISYKVANDYFEKKNSRFEEKPPTKQNNEDLTEKETDRDIPASHTEAKTPEKEKEDEDPIDDVITNNTVKTTPKETSEPKEEDCTLETGHYKLINMSDEKMEIRLSDIGVNGPLATFFKTIHVKPNKSGFFYAITEGAYVLEVTKGGRPLDREIHNIYIVKCTTTELELE